jgi:hypothetical protein
MKKSLTAFFNKYDQMNADMEAFRKEQYKLKKENGIDTFALTFTRTSEYERDGKDWKSYSKNPLLHEYTRSQHSGRRNSYTIYQSLVLFKDAGGYYERSVNSHDFFEQSEKVKVIHTNTDGYQFVLLRDASMFEPMNTIKSSHWGHRFTSKIDDEFFQYKYAVIKDGEVIFSTHKRWYFEQEVLNQNFGEEEEEVEHTPTSYLRTVRPFKLKILSYKYDFTLINEISSKFWSWNVPQRESFGMGIEDHAENYWIVFIMGLRSGSGHYDYNGSWFGVWSKNEPTQDEVIHLLMQTMDWYHEHGDDLISVLNQKREEEYDLNKLDLYNEDRSRYLWTTKMRDSLQRIFNFKHLKYFLEDYFENVEY